MPLTDVKIRQVKATDKALKLADSAGLYLEVTPNGSTLWRYRYRIAGRENLYAIGDYPSVSLTYARKARDDARDLIKLGRHPAHARQTERTQQINANALTFKAIAEEWIAKKRSRWAPYYLLQIQRGMKSDIYPRIGRLPIRSVTAADVLAILDRASKRGAETVALNLRQWCSAVFRDAVATLRADQDPAAAAWRRHSASGQPQQADGGRRSRRVPSQARSVRRAPNHRARAALAVAHVRANGRDAQGGVVRHQLGRRRVAHPS